MEINGSTRLAGLLGHPVAHSFSPLIHNTAFRVLGINGVYVAFNVPDERLAGALMGLEMLGAYGTNVTIPHKQAVRELMHEVSEAAEGTGAVNTVVFKRDERTGAVIRYGDNTDVAGFSDPLLPYAGMIEGKEVVVLGAGGSARAVVYALIRSFRPVRLTILARNVEKAGALVRQLEPSDREDSLDVLPLGEGRARFNNAALIVNSTPVGMFPEEEGTPWPYADDFSKEQIVYDLIYNPSKTRFLHDAERRGARTLGGLSMLVAQAAASFVQWTGRAMPVAEVTAALESFFRGTTPPDH